MRYRDLSKNLMIFPPSWHGGPPDPPDLDDVDFHDCDDLTEPIEEWYDDDLAFERRRDAG